MEVLACCCKLCSFLLLGCAISFCAGFTDPPGSNLQRTYLELGPGCSGGQAERQVGNFLVTQHPLEAPEFFLPQR